MSANQRIQPFLMRGGSALCLDSDANAFMAATGISDPTVSSAICSFVTGLKSDSLWTKLKAIYPFVGGTAGTHKYNLKNPLDTDAAHRIVFGTSVTHGALGISGVSSDPQSFGNTNLNCFTILPSNSLSIGVFNQDVGSEARNDIGAFNLGSRIISITIDAGGTGGVFHNFRAYDFGNHNLNAPNQFASLGFWVGVVNGSADQRFFRNGSQIGSTITITQAQSPPSLPLYLLARNDNGTAVNSSSRTLSFAFIGEALTPSEVAFLNTRVQTLQAALGR